MKKILLMFVVVVVTMVCGGMAVYADDATYTASCNVIDGGNALAISIEEHGSWELRGNNRGSCSYYGLSTGDKELSEWGAETLANEMRALSANGGAEGGAGITTSSPPPAGVVNDCATILPDSWCNDEDGQGVINILRIVLDVLTAGVGILATIGLVVSGIQYITARDDSGVVTKVKSRIFNIVIGLLAYGVMWVALEWLIPGGIL